MISALNNNHWLIEQRNLQKDKTAVIYNNNEYSYYELLKLSRQTGKYFDENGIGKNTHVAIISENNLDFVLAVQGLWLIGAIPIPINPRLTEREIRNLAANSQCKYLINVKNILSNLELVDCEKIDFNFGDIKNISETLSENNYDPSSVALIMFTSGSTDVPKCVQLTFNNLFESAKSADSFINHTYNDVWLASLPFNHIGGFSIITRTIISGCTMVITDSPKENVLIEAIEKNTPSLISLVPTMLKKIIETSIEPWKNLRIMFVGGGPANENLILQGIKKKFAIVLVYGSTETASMVTYCSTDNLSTNGISAGLPFNGVNIFIANEEASNNNSNSAGQIIVESKSVAHAYFNCSDEEKQNLARGKYFSNDLGRIDSNENLQIIGRKDDIIISGGENISLSEIKKLLSENSKYEDCSLLGIKDEKWGQSYVLVTDSTEHNIAESIKKFLSERIARYKLPKEIICLEKIPRTELGKIKKTELKKMITADFL